MDADLTHLWQHQRRAVGFALGEPATAIAVGMGGGKTCIAITLNDLWGCRRTLVICPSTVRSVWRREIPKHSTRPVVPVILDEGTVEDRTDQADDAWACSHPTITVVNYEAAAIYEPMRSWILSRQWDLAILDESHRVMGNSRTSQFADELRDHASRRLCLSGTPMTQDPLSVWAQCRFLEPRVFGRKLEPFRERYENRYAIGARKSLAKLNALWTKLSGKPPFDFRRVQGEGTINTTEYLHRLSHLAIRIESGVLDLPPLMTEVRTFRLSAVAMSLYRAIQAGHLDKIETGRWPDVRGSFAITMRLQQITSGWLPERDGTIVQVDLNKAECLRDILEDAHEPVVVFCRFVEDLNTTRIICGQLGLRYGEISQRSKNGLSPTGTMPEWCDVVGVQEQAGGAGIDLTRARIGVDYSPSWSLPNWDQKVARIHRPPQSRPVILYRLVAEGTIDEEITRALQVRREMIQEAWHGLEKAAPASA